MKNSERKLILEAELGQLVFRLGYDFKPNDQDGVELVKAA